MLMLSYFVTMSDQPYYMYLQTLAKGGRRSTQVAQNTHSRISMYSPVYLYESPVYLLPVCSLKY